jgi:hypothetical protein
MAITNQAAGLEPPVPIKGTLASAATLNPEVVPATEHSGDDDSPPPVMNSSTHCTQCRQPLPEDLIESLTRQMRFRAAIRNRVADLAAHGMLAYHDGPTRATPEDDEEDDEFFFDVAEQYEDEHYKW